MGNTFHVCLINIKWLIAHVKAKKQEEVLKITLMAI